MREQLDSGSTREEVIRLYTASVIKGARTIRTYSYPGHSLYSNSRVAYALVIVPKDKVSQVSTDTFTAENLRTLEPDLREEDLQKDLQIYRNIGRMIGEELAK